MYVCMYNVHMWGASSGEIEKLFAGIVKTCFCMFFGAFVCHLHILIADELLCLICVYCTFVFNIF